ncbi:hypothetical protein B0H10DRAFT_1624679, partial [Mycena sp. CBHHK59/15]
LYLSSHTLSVEILRYKERYRQRTPREYSFCRFCRLAVESESHALIACTEAALMTLRWEFFGDVYQMIPDLPRIWASPDAFLM